MDNFPPFIGDWYLEKKLGQGGFGLVTLWRNKTSNRAVAIKKCEIIPGQQSNMAKLIERWVNEVDLMTSRIQNENIVRGIHIDPPEFVNLLAQKLCQGLPLLVMEYCEFGDLRRVLNMVEYSNGIPETEVRYLMQSLRSAISYLHGLKITHRDIKPENILITKSGDRTVYKITDLGYARDMQKTIAASLVGTVEYLAPELLHSDKYSSTVDYWSMGVICFEVICGVRPFIPHQSTAVWLVTVRRKKSEHIAITEDNISNFQFHTQLFNENRVTSAFKMLIENWLTLALEGDPKQRGSVFESCDEVSGPRQVVKIFSELDRILSTKILTGFCMFSYKFVSFIVDETMTVMDLKEKIELETGIPKGDIYLILPLEQQNINHINDMKTKPLELFIENLSEEPMFFITWIGNPSTEGQTYFSEVLLQLFEKTDLILKPWVQIQCAQNALFVMRHETRLYRTLISGLRNYAMYLNDEIDKFEDQIKNILSLKSEMIGALQLYELTVSHTKSKLEENKLTGNYQTTIKKWDEECRKMEQDIEKLSSATENIRRRFASVLRRSKEASSTEFANENNSNFYCVNKFEELYNELRVSACCKKLKPGNLKHLMKMFYNNLKTRDQLIRSVDLIQFRSNMSDIHIEFRKIKQVTHQFILEEEKVISEIRSINLVHHNNIWKILNEIMSRGQVPMNSDDSYNNLPDLEGIMGNLNLSQSKPLSLLPEFGESSLMKSSFCFGEGPDTQSLLEDNKQIMKVTEDLLNDIEMGMSLDGI